MSVTPATAASDSAAADISRASIEAAATRIAPFIIETPLLESPRLNDKLGGFRNCHKITRHILMRYSDRPASFNLFAK